MNASRWIACSMCIVAMIAGVADAAEQEVTFPGAGGITLAGTLLIPSRDAGAQCPAMLLLPGSGPTDRNGNQPPALVTDLLKQIAQGLADQGIATLRYDKRGMYASAASLPKNNAQFSNFFSMENFVGDATGAYRFLQQQSQIDPKRVGILGHSEGGLLALDAARFLKTDDHTPAVLVLISTAGRTLDVVLDEQLRRNLPMQVPLQADFLLRENTRIMRAIKQNGQVPANVPAVLLPLYSPSVGKLLQGEMTLDPCKLAGDFPGPVLLISGSADVQVSTDRDAKLLDASLSARHGDDHQFLIVPNASHNMKIIANAADPGFIGPVAPQAMQGMQAWLATKLKPTP